MNWLGDLHARRPRTIAAIIAVITLGTAAGLPRVQFEDDPRAIFRFQDPQFTALDAFYEEFGADDQDVYLVIDGADLFAPERLIALRSACAAVSKLTEVESVFGLYDVRKRGPYPLSLMPLEDLQDLTIERAQRAKADALAHPVAAGHFLSADATTTMVAVRLKGKDPLVSQLHTQVERIRLTANQHLVPVKLRLRTAGHPPTRTDLLATLRTEVLKFAALSAVVSGLIALVIFRSPIAVAIAVAGPSLGVLWMMGAMGWAGAKIDPLSVLLPTLIFVVGFTDAVHLVSDMQASRDRGENRFTAAAGSVAHLGPACLLTAITTMAGFGSLMVARLECIQRFGATCAAGVFVMFVAVQLVVPALAVTRLGEGLIARVAFDGTQLSTRWMEPAYLRILTFPRVFAVASVLVTLIAFNISLRLRSDQRWTESLPESSETVQVTADCDRQFGGAMFAYVTVEWPEGFDLRSPEVLQVLEEVHAASEECQSLRGPLSVLSIMEGTRRPGDKLADQVRHLNRAPPHLLRRFLRADHRKVVVSIHTPDIGAARLAPDFAELDLRLAELEADHPGFKLHLTGTVVVAARNVYQMISDLAWSLTIASLLIFLVITALFRSLTFGLLSIIPNILPQAMTASLLVGLDQPLTMTSVLTFSICLGLSVDDTVHYLMRYRDERRCGGTVRAAAFRTFRAVGGVMITTSLVLIGGFLAMLGSQMPAVRTFALLCAATLVAAILGDLIMLPSLIVWFFTRWPAKKAAVSDVAPVRKLDLSAAASDLEQAPSEAAN